MADIVRRLARDIRNMDESCKKRNGECSRRSHCFTNLSGLCQNKSRLSLTLRGNLREIRPRHPLAVLVEGRARLAVRERNRLRAELEKKDKHCTCRRGCRSVAYCVDTTQGCKNTSASASQIRNSLGESLPRRRRQRRAVHEEIPAVEPAAPAVEPAVPADDPAHENLPNIQDENQSRQSRGEFNRALSLAIRQETDADGDLRYRDRFNQNQVENRFKTCASDILEPCGNMEECHKNDDGEPFDIMTQDKIEKESCISFPLENGRKSCYKPSSIAKWWVAGGITEDPLTRKRWPGRNCSSQWDIAHNNYARDDDLPDDDDSPDDDDDLPDNDFLDDGLRLFRQFMDH
jgi:hypothetical protein